MTEAPGWLWFTGEPVELARYVVHHLFVGHPLLPGDIDALRADPRALSRRLYEAVRARGINYEGDPPFSLEPYHQLVRQPYDLLKGQGAGNCLDLSLMFAGLCAAARLRPLLALMRTGSGSRHVLVLVSLSLSGAPDDHVWGGLPIDKKGRCGPARETVADVLRAGEFVAVEVTAATTKNGGLPFDHACAEGVRVFESSTEIEIVDPIFVQRRGWKPDLDARGLFGPTPGNPAFGSEVAKVFRRRLGAEPDVWDLWHISRVATEPGTHAHDTRLALEQALLALGAFEAAGGRKPRMSRLQSVYYRAVGRDSDAKTAEVMLVEAAAAEGREDELPGLVRFVLAVDAIHHPDPGEQQDQRFHDWLRFQEVQDDSVDDYRESCRKVTYWALIYLGEESDDLSPRWPPFLSASVDPPLSATRPLRVECSEERFEAALTELIALLFEALPEECDLMVDLVAPRHLLDQGLEHKELIKDGPLRQALSPRYRPRLRWSVHLHSRHGRALQAERERKADWSTEPQLVPPVHADDEGQLKRWLDGHQVTARPCLIAGRTTGPCDPLTVMLLKGQGFILWYRDGKHAANDGPVRTVWRNVGGGDLFKKENMPDRLLDEFGRESPAMIWNDLNGRGSSKLRAGRLEGPSGGEPK